MANKVTVVSKLPCALKLELQAEYAISEETMSGAIRERKGYRKADGQSYIVNGWSVHRDRPTDKTVVGGAALTFGIPADFWQEWLSQNAGFPPVKHGLIYAAETADAATEMAKDRKKELSGFEPIDPQNLPEEFSTISENKAA